MNEMFKAASSLGSGHTTSTSEFHGSEHAHDARGSIDLQPEDCAAKSVDVFNQIARRSTPAALQNARRS
jgi:hypothetical protein